MAITNQRLLISKAFSKCGRIRQNGQLRVITFYFFADATLCVLFQADDMTTVESETKSDTEGIETGSPEAEDGASSDEGEELEVIQCFQSASLREFHVCRTFVLN
jgi:hypothetical protein